VHLDKKKRGEQRFGVQAREMKRKETKINNSKQMNENKITKVYTETT